MSSPLLSMGKLIQEVQKQPSIWNSYDQSYSDKKIKLRSWQKICRAFYPSTTEKSADEMSKIALLQKKWKSVRDYYTKQRKEDHPTNTLRGVRRRKYVYFDMLRFLEINFGCQPDSKQYETINIEIQEEEPSQDGSSHMFEDSSKNEGIKEEEIELYSPSPDDTYELIPEPDTDHLPSNPPQQSSVVDKRQDIDEDEMFLLSLLPSIRKLSPLQKMDFKLEVMGALKRIQFCKTQ